MSPKKSIMRSLGEFFGHVAKAVKADPASTSTTRVEQETRDTPMGRVTLKRTTIEEMRVEPREPSQDP